MGENLPPGFRFHPTDEELITHYLSRKVSDAGFMAKAIVDADLNKCEPWDLPAKASMGEKEWYFFSLRDRKYPTGLRTNRATEAGYWKTTGKDKEIYRTGVLVGMKKTLVFYKGRAPKGEKSNWVMHEYRLENKHPFKPTKEEWVVCRVFQKSAAPKKPQEQTQSSQPSLDESPCDTNSMANEFADIELPNLNTNSLEEFHTDHHIHHISSQSSVFPGGEINTGTGFNMNTTNMNLNMAGTLPSLSSWTTNLLGSTLSPVNSLLLKALQLRNMYNMPRETIPSTDYSILHQQQRVSQYGLPDLSSTNMQTAGASSSSKVLDSASQPQPPGQPFNMDSMW